MDILTQSSAMAAEGKPFAVATVVRVEGSSSARVGSKAIIDAGGKIVAGWVGGGCAQGAVGHEARLSIERERPQLIRLDMTDEILGVGMPCGGVMDVYIEPVLPKPELLIIGHGAIAEALARLGALLSFTVTVNHPGASRNAFPDAGRLLTDDFDLSGTAIGPRTFVVLATQHKGDHLWLEKLLATEAAYIAMISSHHRARLVLDYMAASGTAPEKLARVRAPAGLDLGAATPEEIALSVISEIVALRRGANGRPIGRGEVPGAEPVEEKVISQCDAGGAPPQFPPSR
jgi:xanthine dehydrogenase accessory factor